VPLKKKNKEALKILLEDHTDDILEIVLENLSWPTLINTQTIYKRQSDDTDGKDQHITVAFGPDGDAWVRVESKGEGSSGLPIHHRFRTALGGGNSHKVRNAFLILALAIKLDSEDRPDRQ